MVENTQGEAKTMVSASTLYTWHRWSICEITLIQLMYARQPYTGDFVLGP